MLVNQFNIDYIKIDSSKPIFIFVNHKTALFCWAKLKEISGLCEVITFDSHKDFMGGIITQGDSSELQTAPDEKRVFGSRHVRPDLPHFSSSDEFTDWNLLDNDANKKLVSEQHKFLYGISHNFIDVAFMKNVIKNVYWYYLNTECRPEQSKCDDINGNDHHFYAKKFGKFVYPKGKFILDIDLDFFVESELCEKQCIIDVPDKIMQSIKDIFLKENCVGLTIALEPFFCGGEENCWILIKKLSIHFGKKIIPVAIKLLN